MVSCCPTLPWYPECWSRCWRLMSIPREQMSEDSQAFPCHSRKARLAAELMANPLKYALGGMQSYLVPKAQNLSGRIRGQAFPVDDHNDRANLSHRISTSQKVIQGSICIRNASVLSPLEILWASVSYLPFWRTWILKRDSQGVFTWLSWFRGWTSLAMFLWEAQMHQNLLECYLFSWNSFLTNQDVPQDWVLEPCRTD